MAVPTSQAITAKSDVKPNNAKKSTNTNSIMKILSHTVKLEIQKA